MAGKTQNIVVERRRETSPWLAPLLGLVLVAFGGCATAKGQKAGLQAAAETATGAAEEQTKSASPADENPIVVHIEYRKKNDFLKRVVVTQFTGAHLIRERKLDASNKIALVRFDGGVKVWEIAADLGVGSKLLGGSSPLSVLSDVSGVDVDKDLRLDMVTYGKTPKNFTQVFPEAGPPDPLQRGYYYVFRVEREIGDSNVQVLRMGRGGVIETFEADPRVGTSYALCCNVPEHFFEPEDDSHGPAVRLFDPLVPTP